MPDSVPSGIARSFNSMIPVIITMFIFGIVRFITNAVGTPLNDLIFNFIHIHLRAIMHFSSWYCSDLFLIYAFIGDLVFIQVILFHSLS